ncbi:MAPEG family protein [Hoeflea sp. AS60]|uniref:MAPEG family protein n=1 Tax=Hoeflea sp. AS60 TaxID=3135780 RepID=UPI00317A7A64
MMHLTSLYAVPLGLMMIGLSAYVSALRAKTGTSILDGGNMALAERIRRHGNCVEYVPMALLLMAFAESTGAAPVWVHAAGLALVAGRTLHPMGLFHDRPVTFARIAGGSLTWLSMLISMITIVINQWAG